MHGIAFLAPLAESLQLALSCYRAFGSFRGNTGQTLVSFLDWLVLSDELSCFAHDVRLITSPEWIARRSVMINSSYWLFATSRSQRPGEAHGAGSMDVRRGLGT